MEAVGLPSKEGPRLSAVREGRTLNRARTRRNRFRGSPLSWCLAVDRPTVFISMLALKLQSVHKLIPQGHLGHGQEPPARTKNAVAWARRPCITGAMRVWWAKVNNQGETRINEEHLSSALSWAGTSSAPTGIRSAASARRTWMTRLGQPSFARVKTGLFGSSESFLPLSEATVQGSDIVVPYSKAQVKDAPRVDPDGHLSHGAGRALPLLRARGPEQRHQRLRRRVCPEQHERRRWHRSGHHRARHVRAKH